eukprot:CAMPEP_0172418334 /NCGR_PEP_ID=MMETSP1064-20121228/4850_1 /TAXON_ID=202472 /ORGANISM="Aulacoseira subarctica , Strain CCAP 1002/5" /LENGTH=162 /DNA_ID=CAMNT_0013157239 /DNA_START=42 /DNA_END=527 /DNA_ORIENTATION=+
MTPQSSSVIPARNEPVIKEEFESFGFPDDGVLDNYTSQNFKRHKYQVLYDNVNEWGAEQDNDNQYASPVDCGSGTLEKRRYAYGERDVNNSDSNCARSPSAYGSSDQSRSPTPDYLTCGSKITANFDDTWIARLDELTAYKQKHGNCLVPKKSRSNPQLGIW